MILIVVLDIAAPIFLMVGLNYSNASSVSLLNNFEIVATSLIAFIIFKEKISPKMRLAIVLIAISGFILSIGDFLILSSILDHYLFYLLVYVGVLKITALRKSQIKVPI